MRKSRICKISRSEALSAYSDDMLDGQSLRTIAHHVEECEDCRQSLANLNSIKSVMRGAVDLPSVPSVSFWADTYRAARLSADIPAAKSRAYTRRPRWRLATLTVFGVAAIFMSLVPSGHTMRGVLTEPADAQTIDVSALVGSHADITSDEPLADHPRLSMVVSDTSVQKAGGNDLSDDTINAIAEGAPDASPTPE